MDYHQTDKNGFYRGTFAARPSPAVAGQFLIPAGGVVGSTPPVPGVNQAVRHNGSSWEIVPDFVGRVYWLADHSRHEITARGVALPVGALDTDPPKTPAEIDAEKEVQSDVQANMLIVRALIDEIFPHLQASKPTKAALLAAIKANVKARL